MIRCNSPKGFGKCVVEMDGRESVDGTIVCDIAEDLEFCEDDIIAFYEFAVEDDNYWSAVKGGMGIGAQVEPQGNQGGNQGGTCGYGGFNSR